MPNAKRDDVVLRIAGAAGDGISSTGEVFALACTRMGLSVLTYNNFQSRIRGGHIYFQVRVRDGALHSHGDAPDLHLALNAESVEKHVQSLPPGSLLLFDNTREEVDVEAIRARGIRFNDLPATELAEQAGEKIMRNVVALGAISQLLGMDPQALEGVIRDRFGRKGPEVEAQNVEAFHAGRRHVAENGQEDTGFQLLQGTQTGRLLVSGNQAFAFGALVGGCRFVSAYPISPATSIMEWLSPRLPKYHGAVVQAEDEIAAINMAIGAAYGGLRAMTTTSGPGLSLMVEAMGLAGMTETPVVVVDCQRPGPSTGLPTKTEQGDLLFLIHASHGEFPRFVIAPATVEDCFYQAGRAFNLAERYQVPVFVLLENALSERFQAVAPFQLEEVVIDRGALLSDEEIAALGEFKRYAITEDGISPRAVPGQRGGVHMTTGVEHDETGQYFDQAQNRRVMMEKRLRKTPLMRDEMHGPQIGGNPAAPAAVASWGSTLDVVGEAVSRLGDAGLSLRHLHFTDLWPFPTEEVEEALSGVERLMVVEQNATGQLARLIQTETGRRGETILKYDGVPFSSGEVVSSITGVATHIYSR